MERRYPLSRLDWSARMRWSLLVTWRRVSLPALIALAVVLAAAVGLASTRFGPFAEQRGGALSAGAVAVPAAGIAGPAPMHRQVQPDWTRVLTELDRARSAAFAAPNGLTGVQGADAAGSAAWQLDERSRAELAAAHLHARGLAMTLMSVRAVRVEADRVVLRVTDRRPDYDLLDVSGGVVEHCVGRGPRTWAVTLDRIGSVWRIAEVVSA